MTDNLAASIGVGPITLIYLTGVFGSLAVELAALVRELAASQGQLPAQYKTWSYPIFRVLFAFLAAGALAVVLEAKTLVAALYIGISAPLIFDRVASGVKKNDLYTEQ